MNRSSQSDSTAPPWSRAEGHHFGFLRAAAAILVSVVVLSACAEQPASPAANTASPTSLPVSAEGEIAEPATPTPTLPPPTPTPQLAAMVNGQPISLAAFEKELNRYEMAQAELGVSPGAEGEDYRRLVLDALIDRELIRQAAQLAGITITAESIESKMVGLRQTGSESGSFEEWLAANNWTEEEFREALQAEMLAEAMIASITADVPHTAEQVRASYIQIDDAALADSLQAQINEGADFGELAEAHSRDMITSPAGGDMGFFARGSLLVPEVEEAAFGLQPGEVSDVIAVTPADGGRVIYYIVKVTDREPDRPLDTNLRHQLLQDTFNTWLDDHRAKATIVYLIED